MLVGGGSKCWYRPRGPHAYALALDGALLLDDARASPARAPHWSFPVRPRGWPRRRRRRRRRRGPVVSAGAAEALIPLLPAVLPRVPLPASWRFEPERGQRGGGSMARQSSGASVCWAVLLIVSIGSNRSTRVSCAAGHIYTCVYVQGIYMTHTLSYQYRASRRAIFWCYKDKVICLYVYI